MTFRESEFPNVLGMIENINRNYPPAAVAPFLTELMRINRAIPLYPGLVCMCMYKAFEKLGEKDTPAKGVLVVLRLKGDKSMVGRVVTWTASAAQIDIDDPAGKPKRVKVPRKSIVTAEKFRTDTLEAFWPTLVFDKKSETKGKSSR